jgi:hypothetical protein
MVARRRCWWLAAAVFLLAGLDTFPGGPAVAGGAAGAQTGQTAGSEAEGGQGLYYETQWRPQRLFLSASSVILPWAHTAFAHISGPSATVTGLASTPARGDVVYAVTDQSGSNLVLGAVGEPGQPPRHLATADSIAGKDAWFHGPMSLSPDGRWVLACVSSGRSQALAAPHEEADAGGAPAQDSDLWLVDCDRLVPPRRVLAGVEPLSYAWAFSAKYAVCVARGLQPAESRIVLIAPRSGDTWEATAGAGHAVWSVDRKVTIYQCGGIPSAISLHGAHSLPSDVAIAARALPGFPADAIWSYDGRMGAWIERRDGRDTIHMRGLSGRGREVSPADGARRLLGWSYDPELLAYVSGSGEVRVCIAQPNEQDLEEILALLPDMEGDMSMRDAHGFETLSSPVKLQSSSPWLAGTWAQAEIDFPKLSPHGPCLIYADAQAGRECTLYTLTFASLSYATYCDPRKLTPAQIDEVFTRGNLAVVYKALDRYAQDHDGKLPPNGTGPALAQELSPYLDYRGALSSAHAQGEIRVRLLHPGADLNALMAEVRGMGEESEGIRLLEMPGDNGYLFALYLDSRRYHLVTIPPESAPTR